MTQSKEEYRSFPGCLQNLDCQKRPQLTRRDFWSLWARDKRRNVPGNISSIRPQCAACENLIKPALIRPDETLSHFSPHWEPTFKKVPLQMLYEPALRCICPYLLDTALRNSYCVSNLFCCPLSPGPYFAWSKTDEDYFAGWPGGKKWVLPHGSWCCWSQKVTPTFLELWHKLSELLAV